MAPPVPLLGVSTGINRGVIKLIVSPTARLEDTQTEPFKAHPTFKLPREPKQVSQHRSIGP